MYRRKALGAFLMLMLIFFVIFVWAFYKLSRKESVMDIGLPYYTEDYLVMFFSFVSIVKAFIEIIKVEHNK